MNDSATPKDWPYSSFHRFLKKGICSQIMGGPAFAVITHTLRFPDPRFRGHGQCFQALEIGPGVERVPEFAVVVAVRPHNVEIAVPVEIHERAAGVRGFSFFFPDILDELDGVRRVPFVLGSGKSRPLVEVDFPIFVILVVVDIIRFSVPVHIQDVLVQVPRFFELPDVFVFRRGPPFFLVEILFHLFVIEPHRGQGRGAVRTVLGDGFQKQLGFRFVSLV